MLRLKYLLIPCTFLMYACGVGADDAIIGKWQVVREINRIRDDKMDSTITKVSDFSYDQFNFKTARKLEITRGAERLSYDYSINDGVLRFISGGDTAHYGVQKVNQDSLVLYREENWANTLRISSTLYFRKAEK